MDVSVVVRNFSLHYILIFAHSSLLTKHFLLSACICLGLLSCACFAYFSNGFARLLVCPDGNVRR